VIVAARLEEDVPRLARHHADEPADQTGDRGVDEQHRIRDQEAHRADQVQRLVDARLVIVAMVVPAQRLDLAHELAHALTPI
jgi:hypothetical protein